MHVYPDLSPHLPRGLKMTILIAEDDQPIREGLEDLLSQNDYTVLSAANGEEALKIFQESPLDLALLDIMMPKLSGYDLCREIRKTNTTLPVIFLSAKDEEIDKVLGLELGADDYMVKPFGVHELLARIRTVLRRCNQEPSQIPKDDYPFAGGIINQKQFLFIRDEVKIELSEREIKLITYFYTHQGEVLSRENLLQEVWGTHYYGTTRTLDQHIAKIRQKIELHCKSPRYIVTVHRTGYRYIP